MPRENNYKKNIGQSTPKVSRGHTVLRHGNALDWRASDSSQFVKGTSVWTGRGRRDVVPGVASGWGDLRNTWVDRLADWAAKRSCDPDWRDRVATQTNAPCETCKSAVRLDGQDSWVARPSWIVVEASDLGLLVNRVDGRHKELSDRVALRSERARGRLR